MTERDNSNPRGILYANAIWTLDIKLMYFLFLRLSYSIIKATFSSVLLAHYLVQFLNVDHAKGYTTSTHMHSKLHQDRYEK